MQERAIWLPRPSTVVWSVWAAMSIALIAYVAHFGYNLPYYDDWNLVRLLDGSSHFGAGWLWKQHNAHRLPFPKLVLFSVLSLTHWDFRSGMFFNAVALIFITALLLRVSAYIRGFTGYADLFFPAFLLHFGNFDYLLWNWQLNQMIPVGIVLAILSVMVTRGLHPGNRALIFSSVGIALLPLSGVTGLVYTPGLAAWLTLAGTQAWRERNERLEASIALGGAALSLVLIPLYFNGLDPSREYAGDMVHLLKHSVANLPGIASTAAYFVAQGLGPGSVLLANLTAWIVPGLILFCTAGLLHVTRSELTSRHFAIAALLFLVGLSGLVSAVSISLIHTKIFPTRYALNAAPIFCWLFLVSARNKQSFPFRYVQPALALLSIAVLYMNMVSGLDYARVKDREFSAFMTDLQKGSPPSQLIAFHQRAIFPYPEKGGASFHDSLGQWFEALREAHHGSFASMRHDPVFRELPIDQVSVQRESTNQARYLPSKYFVYGIRVTGYPLQREPWTIIASWTNDRAVSSTDARCYYWNPPPNPQDSKLQSFTCWVYQEVNEIRIQTTPSLEELRSLKVSLLVPDNQ